MVVQNFKSKNTPDSDTFLYVSHDENRDLSTSTVLNRKSLKCDVLCKSATGLLFLFLLIMNITFLFITISKNAAINRLQEQVDALEKDVHMIKYRFIDDNLLKEIADFEKESYADDSQSNSEEDEDTDMNYLDDDEFSNYDENMEADTRSKREVMSATLDGVPIIHESYADLKRRNTSFSTSTSEGLVLYDTLGKNTAPVSKQHTTGWTARTYTNHKRNTVRPTAIVSRTSRVMHTGEDKSKAHRKIIKKSLVKSANLQEHVESVPVTVTPTPSSRRGHRHGGRGNNRRNGHLETADVVAAHYYGNTSHLIADKHHGYRGNGHLAHPQGLYVDWQPSHWMSTLGAERSLQLNQGEVIVREAGLYLIYAQIYYVDEHDINGFYIIKNGVELSQCTTMTHTERKLDKRNTCWTGTLAALSDGDKISVRDIETHRYAYLSHGKSFFGLIKLADLNIKQQHHHTHSTIK